MPPGELPSPAVYCACATWNVVGSINAEPARNTIAVIATTIGLFILGTCFDFDYLTFVYVSSALLT